MLQACTEEWNKQREIEITSFPVRDAVMAEFRQGKSRVLITTDVWARGIPQI